jgi:hypothetical protein
LEVDMVYLAAVALICGTGVIVLLLKKRADKDSTSISVR